MPLFLILFILVSHSGVATSTLDIHYFCLGFGALDVSWSWLEAVFAAKEGDEWEMTRKG